GGNLVDAGGVEQVGAVRIRPVRAALAEDRRGMGAVQRELPRGDGPDKKGQGQKRNDKAQGQQKAHRDRHGLSPVRAYESVRGPETALPGFSRIRCAGSLSATNLKAA